MAGDAKQQQLILNRIEGKWAILETEAGMDIQLPLSLLPAGAKEGQGFRIEVTRDDSHAQQTAKRISDLQRDLRKS